MDARFEYRLEKTEHVQGLKAIAVLLAVQDARRRICILLGFFGLLFFIEWRIPGAFFWLGLGIVLYCIAYVLITARQYALSFDPASAGCEVEIRDAGVVQKSQFADHHWPWAALRRVEELRDVVLLQFAGWDWIALPNRLWADASERSQFVAQARRMEPNVAAPRKWPVSGMSALSLMGGVAAGLNAGLLAHGLLYLLGYDMCSCAVRHSTLGFGISIVIVIASLILIPCTIVWLERLRRSWPRLSSTIGIALILPQALIGAWFALWFLRFL